ncbi:hypothetical protein CDD83_7517 [Cordyceps sp. RAO-2017]|nr:hypothetical protein CDD83_7517 [Cordyceps sp. RAO-2017]
MRFDSLFTPASLTIGLAGLALGDSPVIVGFVQSWLWEERPAIREIDFSSYTYVNMAFSIPQKDGSSIFEQEDILPEAVRIIHDKKSKVLMSYGGWTGSANFSDIVNDDTICDTFIDNIIAHTEKHNLDGVDIDWEYPGREGDDCNVFHKESDTDKFSAFLTKLRKKMDERFPEPKKIISLAVATRTFEGPDGPIDDVSAFIDAVDFMAVMLYDMSEGEELTGPNAPLDFVKDKGTQTSFKTGLDAWAKAKWPAEKTLAGVGFYGRASIVDEEMTPENVNPFMKKNATVPAGDKDNQEPFDDPCSNQGPVWSGEYWYRNLLEQKILQDPTTAGKGWIRNVHDPSKTPILRNLASNTLLSYDDPESITAKVKEASSRGLKGIMIWSIDMDTPDQQMTNAIQKGWET